MEHYIKRYLSWQNITYFTFHCSLLFRNNIILRNRKEMIGIGYTFFNKKYLCFVKVINWKGLLPHLIFISRLVFICISILNLNCLKKKINLEISDTKLIYFTFQKIIMSSHNIVFTYTFYFIWLSLIIKGYTICFYKNTYASKWKVVYGLLYYCCNVTY